jgi:hypothetical protein
MAKYKVEGTIEIKFEIVLDNDDLTTKPEAIEIGQKAIEDFYNVNVVGGYHDSENCKVTIDANRVKKDEND